MTTDVPDTLVSLARDRSLSAASTGSANSATDHILKDMEQQAAAAKDTGTTTRRRRKTSAEVCKEDEWMAKLQENIEANNQLLQQVMQERAQPVTQKSAFLNYFVKYMQAAPDHHFLELQLLLYDRIGRQVSQLARTSAPAAAAPQPQPPLPPPPPPIMLSPGKQTSYYTFPGLTSPQFPSPQWPQQQQQQQQQLSTPLRTRSRETSESLSRLLASAMMDEWGAATPGPSTSQDEPQ